MDINQKGIICLLKSAITAAPERLPEGFSLEQAENILEAHGVLPLGFTGAAQCGISMREPIMQKLFVRYRKAAVYSVHQMDEISRVEEAFEEAGIDYMPVKGCNMKKRYPCPELRGMGDADILIRMEQYSKIKPVMESIGFTEWKESDHELLWLTKDVMVELHKRLIPSYNKDFASYYGNGWQLGKFHEGHRFFMSPEDEYLYLFTHFSKHYRDGGIGLRQLMDLWVFRREYPQLDINYMDEILRKLGLNEFFWNIQRLLDAWFCDGLWDEKTEFISNVIFNSGAWGKQENHDLSASVKWRQSRSYAHLYERFRRLVFPTAEELAYTYPILRTKSYLLPLVWIRRVFDLLFFKREKIRYQLSIVPNQISNHEKELDYVGLRYHFRA